MRGKTTDDSVAFEFTVAVPFVPFFIGEEGLPFFVEIRLAIDDTLLTLFDEYSIFLNVSLLHEHT
jgi:hypothetical protein